MKKLLLLSYLCLGVLIQIQAQDQLVAESPHKIKNLTTGILLDPSYATIGFLGVACVGDTHQITVVPYGDNNTPDNTLTPLYTTPSVTFTNGTYPTPVTVVFNEAGNFYFEFGNFINTNFLIQVFESDITIDASSTTVFQGQEVDFSCQNTITNLWSMGDSTIYTNTNELSHIYYQPGTYTVNLDFDNESCSGQDQILVTVLPNTPSISTINAKPCVNETITLSSNSPYPEGVESWVWTANGENIGNGQQIEWTPTAEGTYTVTVSAWGAGGNFFGSNELEITTHPNVDLPIVLGDLFSCDEKTYTLSETQAQYSYQWVVENGNIISQTDNQITIAWQNDQALLAVLVTDDLTGCQDTLTLELIPCCSQGSEADFILQNNQNSTDLIELNNNNSTIQNKTLVINGDFYTFPSSLTFENCQFLMAPESQIIVSNVAGHTQFYESEFTSCLDTMWKGILLRDGKLTIKDSKISDAHKGVHVIGTSGIATDEDLQEEYDITNTIFSNNYIHFYQNYQANSNSLLYGNTFTSNGLLYPYQEHSRSLVAIELHDVSAVTIGANPDHPNTFNNTDIGVYAKSSSANISHNDFLQLAPSYDYQTITVDGINMFNSVGVFAHSTNANDHFLSVDSNNFQYNRKAIHTNGIRLFATNNTIFQHTAGIYALNTPQSASSCNIASNTISNTDAAIYSFGNKGAFYCSYNKIEEAKTAIYQALSTGYEFINNNCVENSYNGIYLSDMREAYVAKNYIRKIQNAGISMSNTRKNFVLNNRLVGMGIHTQNSVGVYTNHCLKSVIDKNRIIAFERCSQFASNNHYTRLTNNLFYSGKYGVYLSNNGIISPQGDPNNPQDNRWVQSNWQEDKAHLFAYESNGDFSPFYYRCTGSYFIPLNSVGGPFMPAIEVPSANLPPAEHDASPGTCGSALGETVEMDPVDEWVGFDLNIPLNSLNTSDLDADFDPQTYSYHKALIHELSNNPELLVNRPDLQNYLETAKIKPLYTFEESYKLADEKNYQEAREVLDEWQESHAIATTTKAVWKLLYQMQELNLPFTNCSPQEKDSIRAWASLCPFTHGTAVYLARSMARQIDADWQKYINDCELSNPIMGARLAAKPNLQLYPNPTTGYVRLESRASSLALYDMLGREHYRSEMNVSHHLFIQDLPQGVYTVKTFDEQGKLLESEKLIKSK